MLSFGTDKNKKKWRYASIFLLLFLIVGVTFPQFAHASCLNPLEWIPCGANSILYGIFTVVGAFVTIAVTIFGFAVDPGSYGPDGMFNKASIYSMWKFIRDFLNLFFILVLLYTAFTIVFQVASNYKKTLLSIVLAALFVNFSFPITRVIIDAGNVPMYFFINEMMGTSTNSVEIANKSLGKVLSASAIKEKLLPSSVGFSSEGYFKRALIAIIFLFLFMMAVLVLALLLVIRMAALLLLVVFSPIGFAASIIPGMKKYSDMWWDNLMKYVLFGPASMLMLYVTTQFFDEIAKDGSLQNLTSSSAANVAMGSNNGGENILFALTIIMLWMTIGIGSTMSIAGAGAVADTAKKFSKWAGKKVTVSPARFVGRKVDSKLAGSKNFSFLSPGAWKLAIKQRGEEQKHKDEQPVKQAAARRQDWLNDKVSRVTGAGSTMLEGGVVAWPGAVKKIFTERGKDHTDHNFAQTQTQAGEYRKEISDVSTQSDYVINEMKAALATGNTAKTDAALQILAKNNDLNDMIMGLDAAKIAQYGIKNDVDENGKVIATKVDENGKAVVSSENMLLALQGIMKESGEDNAELLAKKLMVIGDHATGAGNYAFGGMTKFDQGSGKFRVARKAGELDDSGNVIKVDEQAEWAAGKVKNIESQERQRKIHPDSMFVRDKDGFGDINGNVAKEIIKTFTQGDVKNVERSRDDMKAAIYNAFTHMNDMEKDASGKEVLNSKYAGFRDAYNNKGGDTAIFGDYVRAVKVTKEKKENEAGKKEKTPEEQRQEGKARRRAQGATK